MPPNRKEHLMYAAVILMALLGLGQFIIGFVILAIAVPCSIAWDGISHGIDRYFERRVARRGYRL